MTNKNNPKYLKNEIRLKLLIRLPSFQTDVKKIRKVLKIPAAGFSNATELRNWNTEDVIKKSDEVMDNRKFIEDFRTLDWLAIQREPFDFTIF